MQMEKALQAMQHLGPFPPLNPTEIGSQVLLWHGSNSPGYLSYNYVDDSLAVRPSVSLSSCNLISRGNGSPENPYVVYTGSGVCE